jgi:hypothetical protein
MTVYKYASWYASNSSSMLSKYGSSACVRRWHSFVVGQQHTHKSFNSGLHLVVSVLLCCHQLMLRQQPRQER